MKTLGGALFVWNGISQDYAFREAIHCLVSLCDEVCIVCGGDDGTIEEVHKLAYIYSRYAEGGPPEGKSIYVPTITQEMWDEQKGREKISYFMNIAIEFLKTDYVFSLQADEIIYERSFHNIRRAIETGAESIIAARYNVWRDPFSMLNVIQDRKPCSTEVVRLAKQQYRAYNDGEHLSVNSCLTLDDNIYAIEIYHCGFIRDPIKMVVKSRNMLVDIFGMQWDERIGDKFDYRNFPFTGADIVPVPQPIPKFIQAWAKERYPS